MKKKLLFAVLMLGAAPAFAQSSVTLYGIADAGVSFDDNGVNGRQGRLQNGFLSGSRWGMRGSEDLGNGFKAIFNLEQAISLDTGVAKSYIGQPGGTTSGVGFNRVSYVGLDTPYGSVILGRWYTPFFNASLATDNFGLGLYGSNLMQVELNGGDAENLHRASNAVYYTSPNMAGFVVRGVVSAGAEKTTSPKAVGRLYGIGGDYKKGPVVLSVGFQGVETLVNAGTDTQLRKDFIIGGNYDFTVAKLGGGYAQIDPPGGGNTAKHWWVGGTMPWGRGTFRLQYGQMTFNNPGAATGKAQILGVGYVYSLSKQTSLYATYGKVWNNNASRVTLFGAAANVAPGAVGADPDGFGIGMRKLF